MPRSVKAFLVEIGADTADFVRGTQQAETALDDLATDSASGFDKMARNAKDAADDIERAFESAARDAKGSFRDVGTGADFGSTKETFGEAGKEVGAEFASNLGESLASNDVASIAKDTAGGLVSAFAGIAGPIGIGLAGAATVATTIFAKIQAEAEARAARIAAITGTIFDELSNSMTGALQEMTRGEAYQEFVKGFSKNGDLAGGLKEMQGLAKRAGVSVGEISAAFINGGPAAETLRKKLVTIKSEGTTISANAKGQQTAMSESAKAANRLAGYMGEADKATRDANVAARALWDSMIGATAEARLFEAAASRASSNMRAAARAAAGVRGAPGTVVGGRRLAN